MPAVFGSRSTLPDQLRMHLQQNPGEPRPLFTSTYFAPRSSLARTVMNPDLMPDKLVCASRTVRPADTNRESEGANTGETTVRATSQTTCELFEGGLGI